MINKLMKFLGLDDAVIEPVNNQSEMARLQAENRELRALSQDLLDENMKLGRDRQFWSNTASYQKRLLDIYKITTGEGYEQT